MGEVKVNLFHNTRIICRDYTTPKRLKVTYSTSRKLIPANQAVFSKGLQGIVSLSVCVCVSLGAAAKQIVE